MYPPAAVVFDLDGTLIDSRGDIIAAANHALAMMGRRALPGQVIVRYAGDGARSLCARAAQLPEDAEEVDALLIAFVDHYTRHPIDFTRWMPGAQDALEGLSAISELSLAICTNKPRVTTEAILLALGVRTRFQEVIAGGDLPEKKPAPGPLLHLAQLLGVGPERMVMVGDGTQDVQCARGAGVRAIGVEGGFCSRERLLAARPDVMLHSLVELPEVIRRWRDATARTAALRG